jgi:hypothetical protein
MRTFGWNFEESVHNWTSAMKCIDQFMKTNSKNANKYIIVRYEDLFCNLREELVKIITFLNLEVESYDFAAAENQEIIGSSEITGDENGKIHWRPVARTPGFNPLKRWADWTRFKHERFNWIAGDYLKSFGYSPIIKQRFQAFYFSLNIILDFFWRVKIFKGKLSYLLKSAWK